jgi:hypothetical protein
MARLVLDRALAGVMSLARSAHAHSFRSFEAPLHDLGDRPV